MKKKLIMAAILVLSAALLVATSVMGTLAFLASSSAVSNTFTYGDVGIQMLESKVDQDGVDKDGADRTVDGNSYRLVPNKTYVKDPAIYVKAGSVESYLFVKVKNGISSIEKDDNTIEKQMIANGWQLIKSNDAGEKLYIYVETGATSSQVSGELNNIKFVGDDEEQVIELFDSFTVKESAAVADFAGAKVTLTAFAIQTEGFTEAKDGLQGYQRAWNAIVNRFPFESGTVYTAN
jgi:hypothetical protein